MLGLLARADDAKRLAADETALGNRAHADRTIAVNMKLKDASISAIEAAQVLADSCFCQSHEAAVLDMILGVIDELDDVIRALHESIAIRPVVRSGDHRPGRAQLLRSARSLCR